MLYPTESVPFHLPIHAEVPEKTRPTFQARYISARESIRVDKLLAQADAEERKWREDDDAKDRAMDLLVEVLAVVLDGWENTGVVWDGSDRPGSCKRLVEALMYEDAWALPVHAIQAVQLKRADFLGLRSPSDLAAADGVEVVTPSVASPDSV
jgi:hypothetical protein